MELEWITFVEARAFTARIERLSLEQGVRELQLELVQSPERRKVDPGTGGLRKIRMPDPTRGKGKRGGARVHYLWLPKSRDFIWCLCMERANKLH
jgi:hypothetical protein